MGKIFFIADLHLGHENIIKYCKRPFENVEDMNMCLIDNWNKTVGDEDKVFVLGDFALSNSKNIIKWGKAFKGNKVLIRGNHDRATDAVYHEAGFQCVYKYPIFWNQSFLLSHAPIAADMGKVINIHGHTHNQLIEDEYVNNTFFCVSAEMIDYKPINFKQILAAISCE